MLVKDILPDTIFVDAYTFTDLSFIQIKSIISLLCYEPGLPLLNRVLVLWFILKGLLLLSVLFLTDNLLLKQAPLSKGECFLVMGQLQPLLKLKRESKNWYELPISKMDI